MELKKKFKKVGFIFGLEREMKLFSNLNKKNYCVYGYSGNPQRKQQGNS